MQGFGQKQQYDDGSELVYWIWLSQIPGIGNWTRHMLLTDFTLPREIYHASEKELCKVKGVGTTKVKQILGMRSLEESKRVLDKCDKNGIRVMTMNHPNYPDTIKTINEIPTHFYYKGNLRANITGTAIVGARRCTVNGKNIVMDSTRVLVEKGISIISGMAKGIDSYAHTACLKASGYTVAVLGNGLDICYPSEHKLLMQRIEEQGLLLSEYEPGIRPQKTFFPARNRIIAALSNEVIVVEAGRNSGALITAEFAKKYGRRVEIRG